MNSRFLFCFILAFSVVTFLSCGRNATRTEKPISDTTAALSLLFSQDFLARNLGGFSGLERPSPFGDTIIFRSDSFVLKYLPTNINGFHFKYITEKQICEQAIKLYSDSIRFPDFLQLNRFEKLDSSYYISLQVTCVTPLVDQNGKRLTANYSSQLEDCIFGLLCGGGIGVSIYKDYDSFKIKVRSSWSD